MTWIRKPILRMVLAVVILTIVPSVSSWGENKTEKSFLGVITDSQGVETEMTNLVYYWEEKVSETAFVPHELRYLPVKRGTSTVNVKFESIKQVEAKPSSNETGPTFTITLKNGKSGDFTPAVMGSFRGESDFGQTDVPVTTVRKVLFR